MATWAQIRQKTQRRAEILAEEATVGLLGATLSHVPTITGRLSSSFRFATGSPDPGNAPSIEPYPDKALTAESTAYYRHQEDITIETARQAVRGIDLLHGSPIGFLTDSVPYAEANELGEGWGRRATNSAPRQWDYGPQPKVGFIEFGRQAFASAALQGLKTAIAQT